MNSVEETRRARFQAARRAAFAEMSRSSARMRLMWVVPFNVAVLAILVARGLPGDRTIAYGGTIAVSVVLFVLQAVRPNGVSSFGSFVAGFLGYSIGIVVTGGLASPLVPVGFPMLVSASVVLEPTRAKKWFYGYALVIVVALAVLTCTPLGQPPPPLASFAGGRPTVEFVAIAFLAVTFSAVSHAKFGRAISAAYERIALELMTRREELCSESEARTKALEGIAARLAHEVKNPLAAIKGLSTHMARNAADAKTAERLSIVAGEADRLQQIVESFLTFSRGLDDLQPAPTKPYDVARELALLLETRASDAGVSLEVEGDASATLEADPRKLRQALLNLVLNAMQASPRGERVTLDIGRTCPRSNFTKIRVIDHGAGMSPEVLERIKKPYFTTREGGTGLGVAVARGIIEQHGGTIDYESAPGKGTTVVIRLPQRPLPDDERALLPKVHCGVAMARAAAVPVEPEAAPPHEAPLGAKA